MSTYMVYGESSRCGYTAAEAVLWVGEWVGFKLDTSSQAWRKIETM